MTERVALHATMLFVASTDSYAEIQVETGLMWLRGGGNVKRFIARTVLALLTLGLACGAASRANAQGLSGQIGGSVIDASKGAIPGATVTVRNTATAVTRDAVTDGQGLFVFTNLFAGTYDLRVTLTGFRDLRGRRGSC